MALIFTSLGAQILENMNPMHAFTGNLVTNSLAQHYKSDVDHATAYKARLNTSNQDISSNNVVSFLEELVHPTRSHEAFSMMSSASKRLTTNEESNEAILHNLQEIKEADLTKHYTWAE